MKSKLMLAALSILLIITIPSVASASLEVNVTVGFSELMPYMDQTITATANERGVGMIIVLQPSEGQPWTDFLDSHPALKSVFNSLPPTIKTQITNEIGQKIVSFNIVSFGTGGGSKTCVFPDEFWGINGAPSTATFGEYTVIFAYISWERDEGDPHRCFLARKEFGCKIGGFNVIPEVPLGTVMVASSMGIALISYYSIKKPRKNKEASN